MHSKIKKGSRTKLRTASTQAKSKECANQKAIFIDLLAKLFIVEDDDGETLMIMDSSVKIEGKEGITSIAKKKHETNKDDEETRTDVTRAPGKM